MALSALVTGPLWYLASIKCGKRATWLLSSGLMFCSGFLFLAIGKGDVDAAVALAAVQGAILGNFYLSDAILADIIEYVSTSFLSRLTVTFVLLYSPLLSLSCSDYNPHSNHISLLLFSLLYSSSLPTLPYPTPYNYTYEYRYEEYISGQRMEASFVMAKSIIGKLCAVPAAALPIALLDTYGYISVTGGHFPVKQPHSAEAFIKTFLVTAASLFSLLSLYCKIQYVHA